MGDKTGIEWTRPLGVRTVAEAESAQVNAERDWDEAQEVSRIVSHLNGVIASVRYMAERAERKGYDLDPVEVLDALDPRFSPESPSE